MKESITELVILIKIKMNKKLVIAYGVTILLASPLLVFAVPGVYGGTLSDLVGTVSGLVEGILWTIAVTFVIIMFVLAGFKFLTAQGDPSKLGEARLAVIWGLAGAAVIALAWSIVSIVKNQVGV